MLESSAELREASRTTYLWPVISCGRTSDRTCDRRLVRPLFNTNPGFYLRQQPNSMNDYYTRMRRQFVLRPISRPKPATTIQHGRSDQCYPLQPSSARLCRPAQRSHRRMSGCRHGSRPIVVVLASNHLGCLGADGSLQIRISDFDCTTDRPEAAEDVRVLANPAGQPARQEG